MKKLLLLFLVLTGMVSTARATQKVYLKTGETGWGANWARFALYMFGTGGDGWVDFTSSGYSGILNADFDDTKYTGMVLCQMNPGESENSWSNMWRQSVDLSAPTTPVVYDVTGTSGDHDPATKINPSPITPTTYTFELKQDDAISAPIMPYYMDANSSASALLTSNGDFTYSLAVTGNIIETGTYKCKVYGSNDWWYGNVYDGWSGVPVNITEDGQYNLTFSFNYLEQNVTASATKAGDVNITKKYIIAGAADLLGGHSWDVSGDYNVMTVDGSTATLEVSELTLAAATYEYKAVQLLLNNGVKYKTNWANGDNKEYVVSKASVYDGAFAYDITNLNSASLELNERHYLIGGTGDWGVIGLMNAKGGVYTREIANGGSNYWFAIAPISALNAGCTEVSDWNQIIRPAGDSDYELGFINLENQATSTTNGKSWKIPAANTFTINMSYDRDANKWGAAPYFNRDIDGYATFSFAYDVAIPDGVTAYYATAATVGSVTMTSISDGIPADEGVLLKAENNTYKFVPATSVESSVSPNLMVKGTDTGVPATDAGNNAYRYVFALQGGQTGFYNVAADITADMTGKAYLETTTKIQPDGGAHVAIIFDDETTGIKQVETAKQNVEGYYNLAGQRVAQPTKGLYIVNGKKVAIK